MSSFNYFCYLAGSTAEWLGYFGIITGPLLLVAVPLVACAVNRQAGRRMRVTIACALPAIIPICIVVVGVAFVRPEFPGWCGGVSPWFPGCPVVHPQAALTALICLHLPLGLGLGWWVRPEWPAAVAAMLWWGWVSLCPCVMAQMSITGNWL